MGYHVMNSEITPETIGNRDVTFGDDLVLREVIPVGIDGELLSPDMNKPRFMSTPIESAKDTLTFDDMDVTIPFGIDLFSADHVAI